MNDKEIWKDIDEFNQCYQVSNYGRVRSVKRYSGIGKKYYNKITLLKTFINKSGYEQVPLSFKGKQYNKLVHRLVAYAFIENPKNYEEINHIDENKLNNNYSNLEWTTHYKNCIYGNRNAKISKALKKKRRVENDIYKYKSKIS